MSTTDVTPHPVDYREMEESITMAPLRAPRLGRASTTSC